MVGTHLHLPNGVGFHPPSRHVSVTHYGPSNHCGRYQVKPIVDKKAFNEPSRGGAMGDQIVMVTINCKNPLLSY